MAAARYWRLIGLSAKAGSDLELSAIALYAGGARVDNSATISCSHAPIAGALANLQDADSATTARFSGAAVRSGGFWLQWDFGAAVDVAELRLGAAASASTFAYALTVEQRGAGAWGVVSSVAGIVYPGAGALTTTAAAAAATAFWNASDKYGSVTLSDSGSTVQSAALGIYQNVRGTLSKSTGKWYWENRIDAVSAGAIVAGCGVANVLAPLGGSVSTYVGADGNGVAVYSNDGAAFKSGVVVGSGSRSTFANGDVIGLALDVDVRTLQLYKNNSPTLTIPSLPLGALYPAAALYGAAKLTALEGPGLIYSPPAGYDGNFLDAPLALPESVQQVVRTADSHASIAAKSVVAAFTAGGFDRVLVARDIEHGGPGTIYGTTKTKGSPNLPTKARVVLLHQRSKQPVRETWSDPVTGAFAFTGIDTTQQFLTLAEDAAGNFRPVAANRLTPEVLP